MAALDNEDSGQNRSKAMEGLLFQWCNLSGPRTLQADNLGLATALDSARLSYHAQEIRSLAPSTLPSTFESSKPLVMHSPASSPQPTSPAKNTNLGKRNKSNSKERERATNSQSDSGVFTSDSSKENEDKEEKKGKGKPRRIVKRKLISYRVKTRNSETEQLESTDGSLELKEKQAELPPVKNKHTLQLKERQNFKSPRTPQKLPSIHKESKGERRREGPKIPLRRTAKSVERLTKQTEKKLEDHKSSDGRGLSGSGELISNERKNKIGQHSSRLRPLVKQQRKNTPGEESETLRHSRVQTTKRSFGRRRPRDVEEETSNKTGPPSTADTLITDVRRSKSETTLASNKINSDKEGLSSRSASISKIPLSSRKGRKNILKADVVNELTEEEPPREAEDKVLALLKLDETFTRDDFGNKLFSASSNSPRALARTKSKISVRSSSSSKRSDSSKSFSNSSRSNDAFSELIATIMEQKRFVNINSLPELIRKKVRSDKGSFFIKRINAIFPKD